MSAPLAAAGDLLAHFIAWDRTAFLLLNGFHSPVGDVMMSLVSSAWVLVPVHLLLVFGLLRRPDWRARAGLVALLLACVLIDLGGAHLIKEFVQRPRPSHEADLASAIHLVDGRRGGAFSFVSTHATYAFTLAAFAATYLRRRRLTVLLFLWAALVGYSRIYLGLHFPGDVLGGAVWGAAVVLGVRWLVGRVQQITLERPLLPTGLGGTISAGVPHVVARPAPSSHAAGAT